MFGDISNSWWILIFIGLIAGIASGLLGIGGGVIIIPSLVILFSLFDQKTAQGISLAVMIPMGIAGCIRYAQNPEISINWYAVAFLALGAIIGSLIGTSIVMHLPVPFLRKCFAVLLVLIAFKMFIAKPNQPIADTNDRNNNSSLVNEKAETDKQI